MLDELLTSQYITSKLRDLYKKIEDIDVTSYLSRLTSVETSISDLQTTTNNIALQADQLDTNFDSLANHLTQVEEAHSTDILNLSKVFTPASDSADGVKGLAKLL